MKCTAYRNGLGAFQRIFGAFLFLENKFVSQAKPILYIFSQQTYPIWTDQDNTKAAGKKYNCVKPM